MAGALQDGLRHGADERLLASASTALGILGTSRSNLKSPPFFWLKT
jgi:hypothetical protein